MLLFGEILLIYIISPFNIESKVFVLLILFVASYYPLLGCFYLWLISEILILGCGRYIQQVDPELRRFIRSTGMKLEAIDSVSIVYQYSALYTFSPCWQRPHLGPAKVLGREGGN